MKRPPLLGNKGDFEKGEAEGNLAVLTLLERLVREWRRK